MKICEKSQMDCWKGILLAVCMLTCSASLAAENKPASPQPRTNRYTNYERLTLTLHKAFANKRDITLHLGIHDDEVLQAWAELQGVSRAIDHFDRLDLKVKGYHLEGTVVMTVYVPAEEKIYRCSMDIDTGRSADKFTGTFTFGATAERGNELVFRKSKGILEPGDVDYFVYGRNINGDLDVLPMQHAAPDFPVRFTMHTMHVLAGRRSGTKYVQLEFTHKKGKVTDARIQGRGAEPWVGKIKSIKADFDGENVNTTLTAYIEGDGLEYGDYTLELTGRVRDNLVVGTTKSTLAGKTIAAEAGFGGQAVPLERKRLGEGPVYRFTMPTAREGRLPLLVYASIKNGRWNPGRAIVDWRLGRTMDVDLAKLKFTKSSLIGDVRVNLTPQAHAIPGEKPMPTTYTLNAGRDKPNYTGWWTCTYGNVIKGRGLIRGVAVSQADLTNEDAIERDWPCWNGPNGNFTAESKGHTLIDNLEHARLLWRSEKSPPGRCQTTRYGDGNIENFLTRGGPAGGSCSPIIVDGKVFLAYPRPAGDRYHETDLKHATGNRGRALGLLWKHKAEDVVLALDASTGQTLWRTVFPDGLYRDHPIMGSSKIGVYSTNVAAADGRVFARTTSGWTFALDADTGKVLWSSQHAAGIHRAVIGGVLVSSSPDLVALDIKTGQKKWTVENSNSRTAMPVRWVNAGKPYIIVGNAAGQIRCIDPDDGSVLWTVTDSGINAYTLTVGENHLLANQQNQQKKPARLGCYRISRKGYQKLWELSEEYPWKPDSHPPVIRDRYVIVKTTVGGPESRGDDLAVFDIDTGRLVHRIASNAAGSNGQTYWMDGRLITQADASHSHTPLLLYDADDPLKLRQLGDVWNTWHRTTSAYSPMFTTHALADGRIIIRGARGLFCYDLRKP